jgi:HlyD family secretion protein
MAPGSLFMQVVDTSTMQVEGLINQADAGQFRIGQSATIRLDAYPGAEYKGRVYSIGALATPPGRQGPWLRTIPIKVQIEDAGTEVLPDLTASAEVIVEQVQDTLLVPAEALIQENGQTFVQVQKPEGVERRAVTPTRVHGSHAALASGVNEGEVVVLEND